MICFSQFYKSEMTFKPPTMTFSVEIFKMRLLDPRNTEHFCGSVCCLWTLKRFVTRLAKQPCQMPIEGKNCKFSGLIDFKSVNKSPDLYILDISHNASFFDPYIIIYYHCWLADTNLLLYRHSLSSVSSSITRQNLWVNQMPLFMVFLE